LHKIWCKSVPNLFCYRGHRQRDKPTAVKTYSLAFVVITTLHCLGHVIKAFGTAALVSWSLTSLVTVAYLKRNKVYYFEPCWHLHFFNFSVNSSCCSRNFSEARLQRFTGNISRDSRKVVEGLEFWSSIRVNINGFSRNLGKQYYSMIDYI